MTPREKRELDGKKESECILKLAVLLALGILIIFFGLLIINTIL